MPFLSNTQIAGIGFGSCGIKALISDKAVFYNPSQINLGDSVRIDDFCVLSAGDGGIFLGDHIHIGCHATLIGNGAIRLGDFSGLSARVSVYSSSDDFSGKSMTNPTIPNEFRNVKHAAVNVGRHCIIGVGSAILPGSILEEGAAVGALSLVSKKCAAFTIYSGVPARKIGQRSRNLLEHERKICEISGRDRRANNAEVN
jgi:galactoside O-acetyltransferase